MRGLRAVVMFTALLLGPQLLAGEQLPVKDLVARAEAIGVVDVKLAAEGETATVSSWIVRDDAPVAPYDAWLKLCVPDREILRQWLATHPEHPGRPYWRRALDAGGYTAVVFFREEEGRLVPTCETEAMLARAWTLHPEHAAWRAELSALVERKTRAPTAPTPSAPAPPAPVQGATAASCG